MELLLLSGQQSSGTTEPDIQLNIEENLTFFQKFLGDAYDWFIAFLPKLIGAILIFVIGWWLTKVICKLIMKALNKSKAEQTVVSFLHSVISATLKILVVVCVLSALGIDMTTIIAAISAATITIGLALKDSLANVASGTLIILNKKFKIGDYLETEGLKGKVVKIDMMYTTLCTYDNKEILIPNSRLTSNNIVNYFVKDERRIDLIIPIAYTEDISKARDVIMELIHNNERVIQDKYNRVAVDNFADSSVELSVWIWCSSDDYWSVLEEMKEKIKNALDDNNIEIPYNQLDLHIVEDKTGHK